jgi:hypothetical protein
MGLIDDEIKRANEFGDNIQNLVVAKGQCPTGDRNTPLMALWSLAFEIHRAILCLISHKFFGAANALLRSLVEAVIRSHIVVIGSDEDLKRIVDDEYRTNFKTVGKQIDEGVGTGDFFEDFLNRAIPVLHSYTHVGKMQLGRRFSGTDLAPNYSEGELLETIRVSTSAIFLVNNMVTKHLGFAKEWEENSRLYTEWGT